jgi:hypothetical protein
MPCDGESLVGVFINRFLISRHNWGEPPHLHQPLFGDLSQTMAIDNVEKVVDESRKLIFIPTGQYE